MRDGERSIIIPLKLCETAIKPLTEDAGDSKSQVGRNLTGASGPMAHQLALEKPWKLDGLVEGL